jgi:hypothetical protein
LNNIERDKIAALLELKEAAVKLGWTLDDNDSFDNKIYVTFTMSK